MRPIKRPLLYVLVASVILGALLGIVLVLRGSWGWFEVRVLLTTFILAVASLCGLTSDLSRTPRGTNWLPTAGLSLTFLATGLLLAAVWFEPQPDWFWRTLVVVVAFCLATVHICLLSIVPLATRFRWVYMISTQVIYGLAALVSLVFAFDFDNDSLVRLIIVVAIMDGALTLLVPLLSRISRAEVSRHQLATPLDLRNLAAIDQELVLLRKRITELEKLKSELTAPAPESI